MTLRRILAAAGLVASLLLVGGCGSTEPESDAAEPSAPATTVAPSPPPVTEAEAPPAPPPSEAPPSPPVSESEAPPAPAPPSTIEVPPPTTSTIEAPSPPASDAEAPSPPSPPSTTEAPPPPPTTTTTEAPPPTTTEAPPPTTTTTTTEAPPAPTTTTEPPADVTILVTLVDGRIEAERRYEVSLGDKVQVRVRSDVAEEVHLHGYDLYLQLEAGAEVVLLFEANLPGVWEAELHPSHRELFQLQVS